jgi:hypothetical protein
MKATKLWVALVMLAVVLALVACAGETPTEVGPTPIPTISPTTGSQATPTPTAASAGPQPDATASPSPAGGASACPNYELEVDYYQLMEMDVGPVRDEISYSGRIPFSADLSTEPAALSGNAQFEVTGNGAAGGCTWKHVGSTDMTLTGNLLTDDSGERKLQVHLDIHWQEHDIVGTSGECSGAILGGLTAPVDTVAEQELPYEDGFKLTWPVAFPGAPLTGESSWTLHVLCDQ